jgi:hypothetical protein
MRKRSPKHRLIDTLAARWANRRYGLCIGNSAMMKGIHRGTVAAYMRNWLAQHGSLPSGTHKVKVREKRTGAMRWSAGPTLVVDFDRLQSDPAYPEGMSAEWTRKHRFSPGERVVYNGLYKGSYASKEERARHSVEGVVVSTSREGMNASVDFENGEKGVECGPYDLRKLDVSTDALRPR